ncbi:GNAT family N-acetyltransferase [Lunatimonas salinarum]|uniref:GNAT family N-acetyltransferase n=1 Tax=Lunatimonas salinarum TaxID=1774590 RepID=UPI001FD7534F|nr:GNAT family N-acetyltransferase [Lunatimonas salinarum]
MYIRRMGNITIHPFSPELAPYFLQINRQWIESFFSMEAFDREQLENPLDNIVHAGGQVWFAEWQGKIVGTVAVKVLHDGSYELIKMGVLPEAQRNHLGRKLVEEALAWTKARGAPKIVLYSNSVLAPAIALYRKMGFQETPIEPGKYARCDIKMEMVFTASIP